nr:MAG TPA: hypothetical protein [Caudoviricetes sp.]
MKRIWKTRCVKLLKPEKTALVCAMHVFTVWDMYVNSDHGETCDTSRKL